MSTMVSQITSNSTDYSTACSCLPQRNHQNSTLLALCEGNPPVTGGFPSQRASNAETVSIPWCHVSPPIVPSLATLSPPFPYQPGTQTKLAQPSLDNVSSWYELDLIMFCETITMAKSGLCHVSPDPSLATQQRALKSTLVEKYLMELWYFAFNNERKCVIKY